MTNNEAIGNFTHAIRWNDMPKKEALEMAIKALEQDLCEDAISRAQAIYVASGYCHPANIAKELANLPSVKPVEPCDNCEVGNPCLYCKHEYEPHESEVEG